MKYQILTHVTILKPSSKSDCTLNGLSSQYDRATLLVPENMNGAHGPIGLLGGLQEIDPANLEGAVFELVKRTLQGQPYFHAEPFGETRHCMFGGNSLDYSGNGFHTICNYPIHIHDRIE